MNGVAPLRVLIVDDSTLNRNEVMLILSEFDDVEVVGVASNGSEALKLAARVRPDLITLDLEMPKLDGFSFLRISPTLWRCPIIVISGARGDKQVFKALELGALDFIAKPDTSSERLSRLRVILREKVDAVRALSPQAWTRRPLGTIRSESQVPPRRGGIPRWLIGVASSTGGPTAVSQFLAGLDTQHDFAVAVAQHMPDKFTRTFAERLNRQLLLNVAEAGDGISLESGSVMVCPGRQCLEFQRESGGYIARVQPPDPTDRYIPNANRMLSSMAKAAGRRTIAVILTGMGDDGAQGARDVADLGGIVVAESEATAVVYGMPAAAVQLGVVRRSLELGKIASYVNDLMRN